MTALPGSRVLDEPRQDALGEQPLGLVRLRPAALADEPCFPAADTGGEDVLAALLVPRIGPHEALEAAGDVVVHDGPRSCEKERPGREETGRRPERWGSIGTDSHFGARVRMCFTIASISSAFSLSL